MTEYRVRRSSGTEVIEASRFDIEDGALVFYESDNSPAGNLGDMAVDEPFVAFKEWKMVKKV
jgi:hypothetical protein